MEEYSPLVMFLGLEISDSGHVDLYDDHFNNHVPY